MDNLSWFQIYLFALGIFIFFYWPVSHWFFSDWYHKLYDFKKGSYPTSFVKMIGTNGILPSLCFIIIAVNPTAYRLLAIAMLIYLALMTFTYLHLIRIKEFPRKEFYNIILITCNLVIISLFFPW